MAAKFDKYILGFLICLLPLACSAESGSDPEAKELTGMLSKDLASSTAALRQRIETCEQKISSGEVPELEEETLVDLGAEREQLLTALGHLHFQNRFECERDAREKVAFDLGMLEMVRGDLDEEEENARQVREGLIYPSVEQLRYRQRYEALPEQLRTYVEDEVGSAPFDLMAALKANELLKN